MSALEPGMWREQPGASKSWKMRRGSQIMAGRIDLMEPAPSRHGRARGGGEPMPWRRKKTEGNREAGR
jgi:hypothetical protein